VQDRGQVHAGGERPGLLDAAVSHRGHKRPPRRAGHNIQGITEIEMNPGPERLRHVDLAAFSE
jgi:hypothetical protein